MGEVAADVIAGHAAAFDVMAMPLGVFTDPEVAQAGMTEADAKAAGYDVRTGLFPLSALGRAAAMNATEGVVKVVIDAATDVILGVGHHRLQRQRPDRRGVSWPSKWVRWPKTSR